MITVTWLAVTGSLCKGNGGREGGREGGSEERKEQVLLVLVVFLFAPGLAFLT